MELFFLMQSFNNFKLAVIPSTLILFTLCEQSAKSKRALGLNRLQCLSYGICVQLPELALSA